MRLSDSSLSWVLTALLMVALVVTLLNNKQPGQSAAARAISSAAISAQQDDELLKEHGQMRRRVTELQYELAAKDKRIAELEEKIRSFMVSP
jgi:hypothetical protein